MADIPVSKAIQNVHGYEVLLKGDEESLKVGENCQRKSFEDRK